MSTSLVFYYVIGIAATFGAAGFTYWLSLRRGWQLPQWFLYALLILPAYVFVAQYLKFHSLHMYADVSHWLQIVHSIATTWRPDTLTHEFIYAGTQNFFTVHFVPLIYIFGLIHRVWSAPEALLLLNGILMLSSAIPMYLLARKRMGHRFGVCMAVLLLWYPTFQYITLYEFEMLRFSIPIIFWMLYFFETKKTLFFFLFAVLALLVREEVGLVIAFFGLYLFFIRKERLKGLLVAGVSLAFFATVTTVIMGAFWPTGRYHYLAIGAFREFGTTPLEVVRNILLNPIPAIVHVLDPVKIGNLAMYVVPLLLVPLLAPATLISVLPNIGVGLLSEAATNSSFMLYYLAPSIPFFFYAFLTAWPRLTSWLKRALVKSPEIGLHGAMTGAMLIGILMANVFFGPSPLSLQFWFQDVRPAPFRTQNFHWSTYRVTDHHRAVRELVMKIPDATNVSTQQFLMPPLFRQRGLMVYPQTESADGQHRAAYVLLDRTNNGLRAESPAFIAPEAFAAVRASEAWALLQEHDGYELYKRK